MLRFFLSRTQVYRNLSILSFLVFIVTCQPLLGSLQSILEPISRPASNKVLKDAKRDDEVFSNKVLNLIRSKNKKEEKKGNKVVVLEEEIVEPEIEKKRKSQRVTAYDLVGALTGFLAGKFEIEGELRVTPLTHWPGLMVESKDYYFEFRDYPSDALRSLFSVGFGVLVDGEEVGKWSLPIRCELWRSAYYATQRLDRGRPVDVSAVRRQLVDILKFHQKPILGGVNLEDYEVTRTVSAEKPLLWHNIAPKPDIRKGKVLEIVAEEGAMKIKTKGVAMENGLINDFIGVRNLQSKRSIQAKIIDENTVQVYF